VSLFTSPSSRAQVLCVTRGPTPLFLFPKDHSCFCFLSLSLLFFFFIIIVVGAFALIDARDGEAGEHGEVMPIPWRGKGATHPDAAAALQEAQQHGNGEIAHAEVGVGTHIFHDTARVADVLGRLRVVPAHRQRKGERVGEDEKGKRRKNKGGLL
jgi:hypothetical protein